MKRVSKWSDKVWTEIWQCRVLPTNYHATVRCAWREWIFTVFTSKIWALLDTIQYDWREMEPLESNKWWSVDKIHQNTVAPGPSGWGLDSAQICVLRSWGAQAVSIIPWFCLFFCLCGRIFYHITFWVSWHLNWWGASGIVANHQFSDPGELISSLFMSKMYISTKQKKLYLLQEHLLRLPSSRCHLLEEVLVVL